MKVRLAIAIAASLTVVVAAPFIGQIRGAIQDALPGQYVVILVAIVAASVAAALGAAIVRIRERRVLRYSLLALAVFSGAGYSWLTATGNASVDAVERVHFVEYGLLTVLFYLAWRGRSDLTALLLPALAVLTVGVLDEGVQWFVPGRVGEWRDVLLNGAAIVCGLLVGIALNPPVGVSRQLNRSARLSVAGAGAVAILVCAAFFYVVHLGHEIHDPNVGIFRSRFTAEELRQAAEERRVRWRVEPPTVLRRLSREDQYLAEGLWHVQRRNEVEREGGAWAQWHENLILETYFTPVLDFPGYTTPSGARWPPEQREQVRSTAMPGAGTFVSDANPFPIYTWNALWFGAAVAGALTALITCLLVL